MRTFKSIKESEISNRIVKELNAAVLSSTFVNKEGEQLADLYVGNSPTKAYIVAYNTCAPIHGKYVETIKITFN
jgi:hypothetical protein